MAVRKILPSTILSNDPFKESNSLSKNNKRTAVSTAEESIMFLSIIIIFIN